MSSIFVKIEHDVLDFLTAQSVEVEHRRIELGTQLLPPIRDPTERRPGVGVRGQSEDVTGVGSDAPRRVRQLEHTRANPVPVCR